MSKHYGGGSTECITVLATILPPIEFIGFCRGNVLKYMWRAGEKGPMVDDVQKAREYLRFTVNYLEGRMPKEDA